VPHAAQRALQERRTTRCAGNIAPAAGWSSHSARWHPAFRDARRSVRRRSEGQQPSIGEYWPFVTEPLV